jgi:hypothetical protein
VAKFSDTNETILIEYLEGLFGMPFTFGIIACHHCKEVECAVSVGVQFAAKAKAKVDDTMSCYRENDGLSMLCPNIPGSA